MVGRRVVGRGKYTVLSPSHFLLISARIISDTTRKRGTSATATQKAAIDERQARLMRNIARFQRMISTYIPGQTIEERELDDEPECTPVIMPSSLSTRGRHSLSKQLCICEINLRQAAAHEALGALLNQLCTRQLLITFRRANIRGTRGTTAAAESLRRCNIKVMAFAEQYRRHRSALVVLSPDGPWSERLKVLKEEDIRGINERAFTQDEVRARDLSSRLQQAVAELEGGVNGNMAEGDLSDDMSDVELNLPIRAMVARETGEG
jgi:hypothetical protein